MKITVLKDSRAGDIEIPAGEYWVSHQSEGSTITLSGQGKDRRIPAIRRRSAGRKPRVTSVSFYCGGGTTWSLVIQTPKQGEFVAMIDAEKKPGEK
jgi:hypothetical protein